MLCAGPPSLGNHRTCERCVAASNIWLLPPHRTNPPSDPPCLQASGSALCQQLVGKGHHHALLSCPGDGSDSQLTGLLELHRREPASIDETPRQQQCQPHTCTGMLHCLVSSAPPNKAYWSKGDMQTCADSDDAVLLQVEGAENLPADSEAAVYVSNHQSFLVNFQATQRASHALAQCSRSLPQPASAWASLQHLKQLLAAEVLDMASQVP